MELDFRSEYLFRTRFVATNMVTSLKVNPIRCANMLCHFGQSRNGPVAIHFIIRGSTATSSATGDYVVVPERCGPNEEPASNNEERTWKKLRFVFKSVFKGCIEITCLSVT